MIISDTTVRKLTVDTHEDVLRIVSDSNYDLICIEKKERTYEIELIYKFGAHL